MIDTQLKGRKVLVTGAGGFIGSQLVERLVQQGALVTAFLRYNSKEDIGQLKYAAPEMRNKIQFYFGDLKDAEAVHKAVKNKEIVFHLGALIGIPYSYQHPKDVIETNVGGTLNVLMAAKEYEVQRLVHVSSSEVYGTAKTEKIKEDHPLQGQSPYSASKIAADKLLESFFCSYKLPFVTIRPFNTYGPRQSMRAVIPTLIAQACFQKEICVGSLKPMRDFTYVEDTVDAFLLGATVQGIEGGLFNLGTDQEVSIGDILEKILQLTENPNKPVRSAPERMRPAGSEVFRLRSDHSFAVEKLGWKPKISLEEGLRRTIAWIKAHPEHYSQAHYVV